jgi:death-on-curing family protein
MLSHKRILKTVAKNHSLDSDMLLIALWDSYKKRFEYLKSENIVVKNKDIALVKNLAYKLKTETTQKQSNRRIKPIEIIRKDYQFSSIGKIVYPISYINKNEILKIHEELTSDFSDLDDPIQPSGIKDEKLLDAAIFHPMTSYEHKIKYPTAESAAAALMYSLSQNHAFHNGNKRTAMVTMLVFLDKHNIYVTCSEDDLFRISLKLADHKLVEDIYLYSDAEIYELTKWIHENSKIIRKGERSITLKKLKQILAHFGCDILSNGRVQRIIKSKIFGITRNRTLSSKKIIGGTISDGQEVDKGLIKSLRDDLELNAESGIDSDFFYEKANFTASDFINKYRNLLKRLSKF